MLFNSFPQKKWKQRNCNLYSPCWVSKTLAQKPAASPVHSETPNESKKRLVAQKQAIGEDWSSLKIVLDPSENAIVKAKFCNHSLGGIRNEMNGRKKKTPLIHGIHNCLPIHHILLSLSKLAWQPSLAGIKLKMTFALNRPLVT